MSKENFDLTNYNFSVLTLNKPLKYNEANVQQLLSDKKTALIGFDDNDLIRSVIYFNQLEKIQKEHIAFLKATQDQFTFDIITSDYEEEDVIKHLSELNKEICNEYRYDFGVILGNEHYSGIQLKHKYYFVNN